VARGFKPCRRLRTKRVGTHEGARDKPQNLIAEVDSNKGFERGRVWKTLMGKTF